MKSCLYCLRPRHGASSLCWWHLKIGPRIKRPVLKEKKNAAA
jgi:hypothetical protein